MANPGNRPGGRKTNVTGKGDDIYKRDDGLGTGPVGSTGGAGRGDNGSFGNAPTGHGGKRAGLGSGLGLLGSLLGSGSSSGSSSSSASSTKKKGLSIGSIILIVLVLFFLWKTGILGSLFGGLGNITDIGGNLPAGLNLSGSATSTGWDMSANTGSLDRSVANGARAKYTTINGNGNDVVTIMVYMCGTDLESKGGMATNDLNEMLKATKINDKINLIVYTGGCAKWQNKTFSNKTNQIWQIRGGKIACLSQDAGNKAMTKASTLTEFINFCSKNFKANRNALIFWDHGGGSLSGYGYDERYPNSGSMTLKAINTALKDAGIKYDFIGFDACLMATTETALMLAPYADYLIASEETEPGIGWYYTNWLNALASNPSMATLDIGKQIVDDFVDTCNQQCPGQGTTLSVIDLAELEATVPSYMTSFATSTSALITGDSYQQVSNARAGTREFATSSKIDQVDFIHLANNIGTKESKALANALLGAVKYNRTSSSITNAYGLSIYFPYKKASAVDNAVATYDAIGMDDAYSKCIQQFAGMGVSGQVASGGSGSALSSLLGQFSGEPATPSSAGGISDLLGSFIGGGSSTSVAGLDMGNIGFLSSLLGGGRAHVSEYIADNAFDTSALVWKNGKISMSEEQWGLVQNIELNVFYDDGEGYIDLGLDNVFEFDDDGNLLETYGGTWVAINNQPCAYYFEDMVYNGDDYVIHGYVPILLNEKAAHLNIVFDSKNGDYVSGVTYTVSESECGTVGKDAATTPIPVERDPEADFLANEDGSVAAVLKNGDKIDFVADYYSYDGVYLDSYKIGKQMVYGGSLKVSDVEIDASKASACYRFTDIYNQSYWTTVIG